MIQYRALCSATNPNLPEQQSGGAVTAPEDRQAPVSPTLQLRQLVSDGGAPALSPTTLLLPR
eukprot:CAMPEP_0114628730 /NCGR_PEP_ID=MMETSP0168-20121206/12981_1 /TAXON_ID=95228 ORGANISM="Vannella sp., Strain DIVA3 517/6/12" /NCGR_SAMPLE_ID=MMETSP0168 /ASSEMBLY_ACC=CAM_ASM_000044 /LENGTH=61 /DNA_ID=CAMNT_0001840141 /DNA_START=302 /DNA_END=487 /DNA_ORIENTATION=-